MWHPRPGAPAPKPPDPGPPPAPPLSHCDAEILPDFQTSHRPESLSGWPRERSVRTCGSCSFFQPLACLRVSPFLHERPLTGPGSRPQAWLIQEHRTGGGPGPSSGAVTLLEHFLRTGKDGRRPGPTPPAPGGAPLEHRPGVARPTPTCTYSPGSRLSAKCAPSQRPGPQASPRPEVSLTRCSLRVAGLLCHSDPSSNLAPLTHQPDLSSQQRAWQVAGTHRIPAA
ncbi:proline-rich protein 2-like [Panthera uncia]|uniref:proline-rich protein 2-like n=1 Tax=Panthera uncia TaxID=29064 RepID=UPI0020FFE962|nr:proline-rich protein 2-like [Panthera uncia]